MREVRAASSQIGQCYHTVTHEVLGITSIHNVTAATGLINTMILDTVRSRLKFRIECHELKKSILSCGASAYHGTILTEQKNPCIMAMSDGQPPKGFLI